MLNESDPETQVSSSGPWAFLRRHRFLIIVVIVLIGGGAWFLHHAKVQNAASTRATFNFRNNAVAVSVATVKTGDIVVRIPGLGTVTPLITVTVRAQVSGIMMVRRMLQEQIDVVAAGGDPAGVSFAAQAALVQVRSGNFYRAKQAVS